MAAAKSATREQEVREAVLPPAAEPGLETLCNCVKAVLSKTIYSPATEEMVVPDLLECIPKATVMLSRAREDER
jgi:hypothetical protein